MSGMFFRELGLPEPDYHLAVGSGSHGHQTGEMLKKIEEILLKKEPDVVLAYGDTNSTLAIGPQRFILGQCIERRHRSASEAWGHCNGSRWAGQSRVHGCLSSTSEDSKATQPAFHRG